MPKLLFRGPTAPTSVVAGDQRSGYSPYDYGSIMHYSQGTHGYKKCSEFRVWGFGLRGQAEGFLRSRLWIAPNFAPILPSHHFSETPPAAKQKEFGGDVSRMLLDHRS